MPRASSSRSSSRSPSRSSSSVARTAPAPAARTPPPPAPKAASPPPPSAPVAYQPQQQGGGIMSTIIQGVAMGAGSAVSRRAVDSVMDSFSGSSAPVAAPQHQVKASQFGNGACDLDQSAFTKCMQENKGSVSSCDAYFSALQQCQSNNM